ncbi:AraC family transcriptional regulator [Arthrobacter sp. CJ23]|uniref:AraC family transcriptional regulator n=1 Tax=Arthrobacter sp. CJ23 TaxID=2972479 RepID=UPI00215CA0BF|nr:AraC family transcriptional regulator [Arthrobacter sp. CJ23]UVJ40556.1 AraC family transcriptional regulator [Arthrobacter sp. CJ23]
MDPLSQFLTGPRAQAAFALRVVMDPPFAIDVQDGAALTVIVAVSGQAWIAVEGAAPRSLGLGQAATVRGPAPYLVTDTPGRPPTVVIGAGQSCRTPAGEHLELTFSQGMRTWGNSPDGGTVLLIGTYQSTAAAGQLVTSALPTLAVFTEEEIDAGLLTLLERELTHPRLGQESALDRVLDLLLLHLVRVCVDRTESRVPSWAAGTRDPVVARALALLHQEPEAPWTVAELALRSHVSRATMAARFRTAVGQPPMAYLTTWRLALAADRLASSTATTAVIAEEVGYSNAFAFSTAFSRVYGVSPSGYRRSQGHDARPAAAVPGS